MEQRGLGPVVGLGTWNTFEGNADLAQRVVGAALEEGCRLFDTSPMYGSERALASALEGQRDEAIVATKIWAGSIEEGRQQFADQLGWFGRIEIEQVHNLVAWEQHVPWLEAERDAGRLDRPGVTHWQPSAFPELARALSTGSFSTLQVPYNPLERECERESERLFRAVHRGGVEQPAALLERRRHDLSGEADVVLERVPRPEADDRAQAAVFHQTIRSRASLPAA